VSRPPGSLSARTGDLILAVMFHGWRLAVLAIAAIVATKATGIVP